MSDSSKVVTIVGQGYVGLPLAQAASAAGWKVIGLDVSDTVVARLNAGESHIDDLSNEDIAAMVENGYEATVDAAVVSESDVVVICVPTPLGDAGAPDLKYVESACQNVGEHLTKDTLVILESTTYPGTTEDFCVPILEGKSGLRAGSDFQVAFSPERVDPGSKHFGIKNTPKLVGGINPVSAERTMAFYSGFVDKVVPLSGTREAESAKLLENTFRHVNIALVNELTRVFHEMDIDVWEVIRGAATKPFGFMKFTPGAGVGGHCIPIDPGYLSYEVRRNLGYPLRFVELAQEINNSAPNYVVQRIAELLNADRKSIAGSTVLLLGVTYKPDISDQRESPAVPIAEELLKREANLKYHDPFVPSWRLDSLNSLNCEEDLDEALASADCVVLLQGHSQYLIDEIETKVSRFLDTTGKSTLRANRL